MTLGRLRFTLVAVLALALAACGGTDAPPTEVSKSIGAAGGTLDGPDGVQLIVPPGALTQDTLLTIARIESGAPALPDSYSSSSPTYELTPHNQQFLKAVTVRMPHTATAGAEVDDIFMANPGEGWRAMQATVSGGMAEWQRGSLSYMTVGYCMPPTGSDPYVCVRPFVYGPATALPSEALTWTVYDPYRGNRYTLDAAATLTINFFYDAALDCGDAKILIRRYGSGAKDGLLQDWTSVPMAPVAGKPKRAGGMFPISVTIDHTDNGMPAIGAAFACTRPGKARSNDSWTIELTVNAPAAPAPLPSPVITTQPVDVSAIPGTPASFGVAATAADTLTINWERSDDSGVTWTDLSVAAPNLFIPAVSPSDNGARFRARVCNVKAAAQTCINSSSALLTVAAPPAPSAAGAKLAAGFRHTCAVRADGTVACWGYNSSGQVGSGNTSDWPTPRVAVIPASAGAIAEVAAGHNSTCVRTDDQNGQIWCWGGLNNSYEPAEIGSAFEDSLQQVAVGSSHGCILLGWRVECWGNNSVGQLGDGSGMSQLDLVQARFFNGDPLAGVQGMAAGHNFNCAILSEYGVACWGQNNRAQTGNPVGTATERAWPVSGLMNVRQLAAGETHACALIDDGTVSCWGDNSQAQFGNGVTSLVPMPTPTPVAGLSNVTAISSGSRHMCALIATGAVKCWGTGMMGNGGVSEIRLTPATVAGLTDVTALAAGFEHTCALRSNGDLRCWGSNSNYQLGTGDSAPRLVPTSTAAGAVFWKP